MFILIKLYCLILLHEGYYEMSFRSWPVRMENKRILPELMTQRMEYYNEKDESDG